MSVDGDVEKLESSRAVGGSAKWCNCYGKQHGTSSKNLKENYHVIDRPVNHRGSHSDEENSLQPLQ